MTKTLRFWTVSSMLALATAAAGCSADASSTATSDGSDGLGASTEDITQVEQTAVKRQSIGNCWLYATASWLEGLHQRQTGEAVNTSETWHTYWHWFEQLTNGSRSTKEISTGGFFGTAASLIARYGIMKEGDFISQEAESEMSGRQSAALDKINTAMKTGVLSTPEARKDRALVRKTLDEAYGLSEETRAMMDEVFGPDVSRTLDKSYVQSAPKGPIIRAIDFEAAIVDPSSKKLVRGSLQDAIGSGSGSPFSDREGKYAWNEESYPYDKRSRREFQQRVQRALHDGMPIIITWKVDFNALTSDSRFSLEGIADKGPGRQGGHMTVLHDYEAEVPGFGLLKAGVEETRPEALAAALKDETQIKFFRTKNSWGGIRPDRWSTAAIAGYHDLEMTYLDGPIKVCPEVKVGNPDPETCVGEDTPWNTAIFPAGY